MFVKRYALIVGWNWNTHCGSSLVVGMCLIMLSLSSSQIKQTVTFDLCNTYCCQSSVSCKFSKELSNFNDVTAEVVKGMSRKYRYFSFLFKYFDHYLYSSVTLSLIECATCKRSEEWGMEWGTLWSIKFHLVLKYLSWDEILWIYWSSPMKLKTWHTARI